VYIVSAECVDASRPRFFVHCFIFVILRRSFSFYGHATDKDRASGVAMRLFASFRNPQSDRIFKDPVARVRVVILPVNCALAGRFPSGRVEFVLSL